MTQSDKPKKLSLSDRLALQAGAGLNNTILARQANKAANAETPLITDTSESHQLSTDPASLAIDISLIDPNPWQPRKTFDQSKIEKLAETIDSAGQIEPIVVRQLENGRYQLIAGERRLKATQHLGRLTIDAVVRNVTDDNVAIMALVENIEREDLSDYEVGLALKEIEDQFPSKLDIAKQIGRARQDVYRYLSFNDLPDWVLVRLNAKPSLINRTNAYELKSLLSNHNYDDEQLQEAIKQALTALEADALTQGLFIDKIKRLARELPGATHQKTFQPKIDAFKLDGKSVGKLKFDDKKLSIQIKSTAITEADVDAIQAFINSKINGK